MERLVKAGEVFTTFIFDGKDCADMGVYYTTSSGKSQILFQRKKKKGAK